MLLILINYDANLNPIDEDCAADFDPEYSEGCRQYDILLSFRL